jgi:isochorismate synthase
VTPLDACDREALRGHLARVSAEARALGRPLLAAFRFPTPFGDALDAFGRAGCEPRFFFEVAARGDALAALGEAARVETAGPDRFVEASSAVTALFARLRVAGADDAPREVGPRLVGGFAFGATPSTRGAFAGFPALRLVLPSVTLVRRGESAWCTLATPVGPESEPAVLGEELEARLATPSADGASAAGALGTPSRFGAVADRSPDDYRRGVTRALAAIAAGELEKVVLARACTVTRPGGFDPTRVLATLRGAHPQCFAFGVGLGEACFVGATPELLLRREGAVVRTSALAGSAARGRTPHEDERLAAALRESKKEQAEHAIVRRAVCDALTPCCEALEVPESPELLQLDGIQHLHTPIAGRLREPGRDDALALLARLHPTPAVAGSPRGAALAFLAARERLERGWYAGGVGWLAPSGDAEFAVALRCAVLRGRRATLLAGAGIVEGSQPDAELAETRLKLRAALGALVEL